MAKETYPLPGQRPKLVYNNTSPEYGATREQWEERLFRQAHHYNVVRITAGNGSEIMTTDNFAVALAAAYDKDRTLIYVVTEREEAFCMSPKDYPKFAALYLDLRQEKANG